MRDIDIQTLQRMYSNSSKFAAIFNYLADRQRNYRETKPEVLMFRLRERDIELERHEVIAFFRELESAGCGRYIEGRRGRPSRFEWYATMSGIGQAARGEEVEVLETSVEQSPGVLDDFAEFEGVISHAFYLRPSFIVRVQLPADLVQSEADRVADWVKTLPFSRD